jgi:hypothetical protein
VNGLFERLREDQAHNPDTMDQRYGAWARLLVLFRLIYPRALGTAACGFPVARATSSIQTAIRSLKVGPMLRSNSSPISRACPTVCSTAS